MFIGKQFRIRVLIHQLIGGGQPIAFIPQIEIKTVGSAMPVSIAIINATGAALIIMRIIGQFKAIQSADRPAVVNFIPGRYAKFPFGARGVNSG